VLIAILVPSIISILAYFLPQLRGGKRVFAPMPGMIAFRIGIEGGPSGSASRINSLVLNAFILLFVAALILGYKIIVESLVRAIIPSSNKASPAFVPVIPGVTVPFDQMLTILWVGALSISLHELAHYWSAVKQGIRVKGGGVGWFLFFPIAFVEPDERELSKAPLLDRVRVYSAGPAINMLIALLTVAILIYAMHPGIYVIGVKKDSPAWKAGIRSGDVILEIDGIKVKSLAQLSSIIEKPGTFKILIDRNGKVIEIIVSKGKGKIGIYVTPWVPLGVLRNLPPKVVQFIIVSTFWFNGINTGLAIINALPMFITDGGRVFLDLASRFKRLEKVFLGIQAITVAMVIQVIINSLITLR